MNRYHTHTSDWIARGNSGWAFSVVHTSMVQSLCTLYRFIVRMLLWFWMFLRSGCANFFFNSYGFRSSKAFFNVNSENNWIGDFLTFYWEMHLMCYSLLVHRCAIKFVKIHEHLKFFRGWLSPLSNLLFPCMNK